MPTPTPMHHAARVEDLFNAALYEGFRDRWVPTIVAYTGYGAPGWVRVMARVLLTRPKRDSVPHALRRGWRSFITVPVVGAQVRVQAGGKTHTLVSDRGGYIDARLECDLPAGWQRVTLRLTPGEHPGVEDDPASAVEARVFVIDPATRIGVVSDVDDTVMVTTLPRALLAAWNTFVLSENARRQVTGMSVLYERMRQSHPDAPFIYVSTGAWNVAPTLSRFLSRNLYPDGPLLLTDWGPTHTAWFRSGQTHKRRALRRLAEEFPDVRWLLIGDDGQHDPDIYADFARTYPGHVAAVAIRTLSPTEQLLASGNPAPMDQARFVPGTPWVSAPDGAGLWGRLVEVDLEDDSAVR
ncbi:MAG: App1 family protein [Actinomycetales bacterium]